MKDKLLLSIGTLFAVLICAAAEPADVFRKGVKELMPAAARFRESAPLSWEVLDGSGAKLGMLHQERIADSERKRGFGGTVEIALVTAPDGKIAGVLVGKNQETPGFLKRVVNAGFLMKWNGMTMRDAAEARVDAVTSATYSSGAIAHGVKTLAATLAADAKAAPADGAKIAAKATTASPETQALEAKIAESERILARGSLLLAQWHNRRAEELELREILLLRGRDAAKKFADARRMTVSDHAATAAKRDPALAAALAACRKSGSDADRQALRKAIAAELDRRITALIAQNAEHAGILLDARQRLREIPKK